MLFRRLDVQAELVDEIEIDAILLGKEFPERVGIEIAHAQEEITHACDELRIGADLGHRVAQPADDGRRRAARYKNAMP